MDPLERIKEFVESNPVALFIKGTPQMPMCGFSSRTAEALKSCEREFAWCNVIADPEIFENLPRYADWPTFPQLYIEGELVGQSASCGMQRCWNSGCKPMSTMFRARETITPHS